MSSPAVFGQAPGNVATGLRWWLKANTGVFIDNGATAAANTQNVQQWNDQSTVANHARQTTAANKPVYRTNILNGNPVLRFSTDQFLDGLAAPGIGATESFYIFLVFKQNSWVDGGTNDGSGTFIIDRPTATNNLTSFKMVATNKYFYQRRDDAGNFLGGATSATSANTTSFVVIDYFRNFPTQEEGIYLDGVIDVLNTGAPNTNMAGPVIRIGRHATTTNGGIDGDIAEMIVYDVALTNSNRRRVETYLAIKYGITLSNSLNYLRSDATVIYPSAGTHSLYVTDIAGIGRDNNSGLLQTTSRNQSASYVVTASGATALANNEFLIWGHNNGSVTSPNTSDVDGTLVKRRLSRVWRVAETGDVGNVTLQFDLSSVPGSLVQTDLRLLVDRDGDGFFDNDITPMTGTLAGTIFTVTVPTASLNNNDYFTIGSINAGSTPLPVELVEFNASYESPVVNATWRTASELNNDYFTLERAGEDLNFYAVTTIPGAGTTREPNAYSAVDPFPYAGKSYYRLKQTDYDGTATYSTVRSMFIADDDRKLSIFPNPGDGTELSFRLNNSPFQLHRVEVYDNRGTVVDDLLVNADNLPAYTLSLKQQLPSGLYLLRVTYNGRQESLKLVVR